MALKELKPLRMSVGVEDRKIRTDGGSINMLHAKRPGIQQEQAGRADSMTISSRSANSKIRNSPEEWAPAVEAARLEETRASENSLDEQNVDANFQGNEH